MERKTALLVVDVQNDFCPGGSLAVPEGDEVIAPLNKMIKYGKENGWLIIASRDWHPKVTNHFQPYGGMWPVHCVQNSEGAKFHPDLRINNAVIISKGTNPDENGYSAFDGKTENGLTLARLLKLNKISEIYVGGLATDYCVRASVLDATELMYCVVFLRDACRAVNLKPDDEEKAIRAMQNVGVVITDTGDVIS